MTQRSILEENRKEAAFDRFDLDAMIERLIKEKDRKRRQAEQLREISSSETSADESGSDAQLSANLDLEDRPAGDEKAGGPRIELSHKLEDALGGDREHSEIALGQHGYPTADSQGGQPTTSHPSMTRQETIWWAMSFEELYLEAKQKGFGKTGKEGRKSGRVRIIKWLCEKEGIIPYVAPSVTPAVQETTVINRPLLRPTGAISHPEAILRTSDPTLQLSINEAEQKYKKWPADKLLELAMQRSYQLLKDSEGKLPSKSKSAMSNWLAAWDVLKSPREKSWWLHDGIDLVNRAKAMGYKGSSKKYDVILWLRNTPEESELEVIDQVAQPTPNKRPKKRKAENEAHHVSKRPAKGSKRPHGWYEPQYM